MRRTIVQVSAWGCLGFIIFATLVPLGLRPRLADIDPNYERFVAYAVASMLMAMAYPRRQIRCGLAIVAAAVVLELCQLGVPDRDARIADAFVKMAGALSGLGLGMVLNWLVTAATASTQDI